MSSVVAPLDICQMNEVTIEAITDQDTRQFTAKTIVLDCKPSSIHNCSDPTCGGGGTIYSNGFFFVQSILADRYIHRREM